MFLLGGVLMGVIVFVVGNFFDKFGLIFLVIFGMVIVVGVFWGMVMFD